MKILLVNNNTRHLKHLYGALAGHEVEEVLYEPGIVFNCADKDLIILSGGGGEGLEIEDRTPAGKLWYHDQMEFVKNCDKPIIGICMGFEVIARAYGASVRQMAAGLLQGFMLVEPTPAGRKLLPGKRLRQYEAHEWHVKEIDENQFEVLAESDSGLEIIRHKSRPILATQFHPEKGGTLTLDKLLALQL